MDTNTETSDLIKFLIEHPGAIASIVGSAAAVGATYLATLVGGWRAANYLNKRELDACQRQIEQKKNEYQRDIDRVTRQSESGTLIDELYPSISELAPIDLPMGSLAPGAEYYSDFHIVLTQMPPPKPWLIQKLLLKDIHTEWFGDALQQEPILRDGYSLISAAEGQSCMLWKGIKTLRVKNSAVLKQMYPFVIVYTVPHGAASDPTTAELFNFIAFVQLWDRALPNAKFEIVKMHRSKNKAYLRGYFKFADIELGSEDVDSKRYDQYYLSRQIAVVRSEKHTVIITAGLPNDNPTSDPYYEHLRAWWDAIRIVDN
jgi:hypothetical protein